MTKQTDKPEQLWPIIEPDDSIPLPPAAWALINVIAIVVLAVPFVVLLVFLSAELWLVNEASFLLAASHFGSAVFLGYAANAVKVFLLLIAARVASVLVDCIPYVIRETRDGLRE